MAHPTLERDLSCLCLMEEKIVLDRVWTVDTWCLPPGSPPTKEDTAKWPRLKGIDFPRTQSDRVSVLKLIGCVIRGVAGVVNLMLCVFH